jgi:hypothetical protein
LVQVTHPVSHLSSVKHSTMLFKFLAICRLPVYPDETKVFAKYVYTCTSCYLYKMASSDNQKNTANQGSENVHVGDVSGSGIIIGHHIETGDVILGLNSSIKQNPNNPYLQGLKDLTEKLSLEYQKYNVPDDKRSLINQSIQDLQSDAKNLKPETELKDLSLSQQKQVDAKTTTLVERLIDALPAASEVVTDFTPLSPFSKLIRGGVQSIVDAIKQSRGKA